MTPSAAEAAEAEAEAAEAAAAEASATATTIALYSDAMAEQVELNEDFYVAVDVQGYKCLPERSKDSNPLQYVLSLNPPLLLENLGFSPLEVIEIDKPCTAEC